MRAVLAQDDEICKRAPEAASCRLERFASGRGPACRARKFGDTRVNEKGEQKLYLCSFEERTGVEKGGEEDVASCLLEVCSARLHRLARKTKKRARQL